MPPPPPPQTHAIGKAVVTNNNINATANAVASAAAGGSGATDATMRGKQATVEQLRISNLTEKKIDTDALQGKLRQVSVDLIYFQVREKL